MVKKSYIIGLPASGKSTFLGALAYSLIDNNSGYYEMDSIENFDYLASLAEVWSQCKEVDRTSRTEHVFTKLNLKDKDGNQFELHIPDQSGEEFKDVINNRIISDEMYASIKECDDILLFINPSILSPDSFINDINPEYRMLGEDKINISEKEPMHEQTQYVTLLQDVSGLKKEIIKLKVIISAWDAYDDNIAPSELLRKELPLVWQYLMANSSIFRCEYWGISAQGGDLKDPNEKKRLLAISNALERIQVIDENKQKSHDLSILLK